MYLFLFTHSHCPADFALLITIYIVGRSLKLVSVIKLIPANCCVCILYLYVIFCICVYTYSMPWLCIVVTTISEPVKLVPVAELSLARPSGCTELAGGRGRPFLTGDMYSICVLYICICRCICIYIYIYNLYL